MQTADAILQDLNQQQRAAVLHRDSPLLVIAGAGSGKTRVVTRRIAHLLATGTPHWAILAVTFTNKAAGEMKERVTNLVGSELDMWVSTFHSLAARILRREDGGVRRNSDFSIYDQDDSTRILKAVLKEMNLPDGDFKPAAVQATIEGWKREGISPEDVPEGHYGQRVKAKAYHLYEQQLEMANALDFNDLLGDMLRLFEERPEVLQRYRRRFSYIFVDEYQDTNEVQYKLVKLLAGDGKGLCAVGDPDQSIYGWRGARISNILQFQDSYADTKIIRLEQNYRSTSPILKTAGAIISNNAQRIKRGLWTDKLEGRPVELFTALDEQHEAEETARRITELVNSGKKYGDCAVFYRTNAQSRSYEEAFLRNAIPYCLVSGTAFYQRAEVKDALAYLRLAVNPRDTICFRRVINNPPRGIGKGSVERIEQAAVRMGCGALQALGDEAVLSQLSLKARKGVKSFLEIIAGIGDGKRYPIEPAVSSAINDSGLLTRFIDRQEEDRVDNLGELAAAAAEYDFTNPDGSLFDFLEQVALVADIDNWDGTSDRISLMTLHAAKGLEFPVVFLSGLEEGLLPYIRYGDSENCDVEEERRLVYVGMTRAQTELVLTWARSRYRFGTSARAKVSRFVGELPAAEIHPDGAVEDAMSSYQQAASDPWEWDRPKSGKKKSRTAKKPLAPSGPVTDEDGRYYEEAALAAARTQDLELEVGDLVVHTKFGRGRIENMEGYGEGTKITVAFSRYGRKKLVAAYAHLERVQ